MSETITTFLESLEVRKKSVEVELPLDVLFVDWDTSEERELFEKHYREIYGAFLLRELPEYSECSDTEKEELLDKFKEGINYFNDGRGHWQLDRWRRFRERYDNHKEDELIRKYAE
jgi:hypothetical protein